MADEERDEGRQEPPKIKVTDRRLFDREGNPRPEAESERSGPPERPPETVGGPPGDAQAPSAPPAGAAATGAREARAGQPADRPTQPPPERQPSGDRAATLEDGESTDVAGAPSGPSDLPRDFAGFIESQYYETLLYLGAMRHPASGQVMEDLDMAQYKIDLLSMIQEKTEGNRTPEESKLLEDVLYQLRMGYLQKRKVAKL